jgi:triosephosphate isomerase (TIM)
MILAANWKMHHGPDEARRFAERFLPAVPPRAGRELVFFPSAVALEAAARAFAGRDDVRVGVQDVHWEPKGAFTGATSVPLAAAAGAVAGLVGHSERRHVFGETDEETGRKVRALLTHGLTPFLCVGEKLEEREAGKTEAVVLRQLHAACAELRADDVGRLVIAYEPVWAIGTGRNASPEDAAAVHAVLHRALAELGGPRAPILYGGSVNPGNAKALLSQPGVNGVLVGGASLDPESWAKVVAQADTAAAPPG